MSAFAGCNGGGSLGEKLVDFLELLWPTMGAPWSLAEQAPSVLNPGPRFWFDPIPLVFFWCSGVLWARVFFWCSAREFLWCSARELFWWSACAREFFWWSACAREMQTSPGESWLQARLYLRKKIFDLQDDFWWKASGKTFFGLCLNYPFPNLRRVFLFLAVKNYINTTFYWYLLLVQDMRCWYDYDIWYNF